MATPNPRNLVLLLSSGHTVRIALRENDLTASLDSDPTIGIPEMSTFLDLPAVLAKPDLRGGEVLLAYVENPSLPYSTGNGITPPDDYQRITVEGPGTVVQYG